MGCGGDDSSCRWLRGWFEVMEGLGRLRWGGFRADGESLSWITNIVVRGLFMMDG